MTSQSIVKPQNIRVDSRFSPSKARGFLLGLSRIILKEDYDEFRPIIEAYLDGSKEPDTEDFIPHYFGLSETQVIRRRQVAALFTKNPTIGCTDALREQRAVEKWFLAESQCLAANRRFSVFPIELSENFSSDEALLISRVRRKISRILGRLPNLRELGYRLGPGASVGVSRKTSARFKFGAIPTCSANAAIHLRWLQQEHPHWDLSNAQIATGRLQFVPKDATKFRSIVVEPTVNTYLQLGLGTLIRSRLAKAGCNLRSQETNRDLCRFGSLTGLIGTIDLSNASDTIARAVVEELLPADWYTLLDSMRTRSVVYHEKLVAQQKFSSMGNGFTFELESLIFFAIAKVVCNDSDFVSVYGDDIIVPTRYYEDSVRALELFGFSVNLSKSFSEGPFRESCGKDFLSGVDVRPVYLKDHLSILELYRLHNFFRRRHDDDIASFVLRFIPGRFRNYGPDGEGDGHLIGDWHAHCRKPKNPGWQGSYYRTWIATPRTDRTDQPGDLCAALYGQHRKPPNNLLDPVKNSDSFFTVRGGEKFELRRVYTWLRP